MSVAPYFASGSLGEAMFLLGLLFVFSIFGWVFRGLLLDRYRGSPR